MLGRGVKVCCVGGVRVFVCVVCWLSVGWGGGGWGGWGGGGVGGVGGGGGGGGGWGGGGGAVVMLIFSPPSFVTSHTPHPTTLRLGPHSLTLQSVLQYASLHCQMGEIEKTMSLKEQAKSLCATEGTRSVIDGRGSECS